METNYKYSIKIKDFIDNNLQDIKYVADTLTKKLNKKLFDDINTIISSAYTKCQYHNSSYKVRKIHATNQYPLMFIFMCKLYESGVLYQIFGMQDVPICDFQQFVEWYRLNHTFINLNNVHNVMKLDNNNYKHTELRHIYSLMYNTSEVRTELHELLYSNNFVSIDIQHHAESVDMTKQIYHSGEFKLVIYYPNVGKKMFDIDKIMHIIRFMKVLAKSDKVPIICIFAGLQRKKFGRGSVLCPDNINSGSSIRGNCISIWRTEEIYKVLIHELIHFHCLDFHQHSDNFDTLEKFLTDTYNIKGTDCPNESYTEALAVIIHSVFVSFYESIPFQEVLKYEITFTLLQVGKILRYFGIRSASELGFKHIRQNTSVFSYFIVKGSLLVSLPAILDFVRHDVSQLSIENKVLPFMELVTNCMNPEYFELIDRTINHIDQYVNSNGDASFIMTTLRMTCS
jgi:hypothetical protein